MTLRTPRNVHFRALGRAKWGKAGFLLDTLTLVDRSGRVPSLMRQHAATTGKELDEQALYEPLIALVRGRRVARLVIESGCAKVIHVVDFTRQGNGVDPLTLRKILDS